MQVSIVIPVYNVAPYLVTCLDSVRQAIAEWVDAGDGASLPAAEIICVDDGSTDGSGRILDEYFVDRHEAGYVARIVHKPNAGVSVARNDALELATGEWVMFLDSDDTWEKDLLRRLFAEIKRNHDCDAVCYSMRYVGDVAGKFERVGCYSRGDVLGDEVFTSPDRGIQNTMWVITDKIFRLATIKTAGIKFLHGIRVGEDSLFAQQFLAVAGLICLRPEILGYNYFVRSASAILTVYKKLPEKPLETLESLYAWRRRYPKPGLTKQLLSSIRGALLLGRGDMYAPNVAQEGLEYLLHSKTYNSELVGFFVRYGRGQALYKFMLAYYFSPRFIKRKLLSWLRQK